MMTDVERDQRIEQLERIEQANPEAVAHERSMLAYAEQELREAQRETADLAAKWARWLPLCREALQDNLMPPELYHQLVKHRAATYDEQRVPRLEMLVETRRTELFSALTHIEQSHHATKGADL